MRKHFKDYFIPHEGNKYKPHSLQKAAMFGMVALVVLSFTLANVQSLIWISSEWLVSAILPSVIVDLTNDARADSGLRTLKPNPVLAAAAQQKAQDMANNEYFAHYSPTGVSPWYWFNQASYNFVNAGENLAIHFVDSDEVVEAWLNSPTHRANIMNENFTEIGIGAVSGTYEGYQTIYVVQFFGTPAAAAEPLVIDSPEPTVLAEFETVSETQTESETNSNSLEQTDPQIAGSEGTVQEVNNSEVTLSTDRDPVAVAPEAVEPESEADTDTEITQVEVTENTVSLYSGLVSTSTGGVPATIDPNEAVSAAESTAPVFAIATKPQTVLQILYSLIGLFVLACLMLSVLIEIRRQHPVQIAYSAGLMAAMVALFYIHVTVTSGALVV